MSKLVRNIMDLLESESENNSKTLLEESASSNYLVDTIQDYVSNGCDEEKAIQYTADFLGSDIEDVRKAWEEYQGMGEEPKQDEEIDENAGIDMVTDTVASNIKLGKTVTGMGESDKCLKESIGDTEKAAQDLEDSISGIGMAEILVPGDDGAIADINFIYDTTEIDIDTGEQRPGEFDLEKLSAEVQQVLSQYITNIETVKLSVARKKDGMVDITGSIIGKDLDEASADLNIGASVDLPDDVVGAAAGALLASEECEQKPVEEGEKLDEIGPLAAGLIGAGVGAVGGAMVSNAMNKQEEDEETEGEPIEEPVEDEVEPTEEPECEACEDEERIAKIIADADEETTPEELAKIILDAIKPEEEHEDKEENDSEDESDEESTEEVEPEDKVNIDVIDEAEEIKEYLEEDEVPAGNVDFAHTSFEEVTAKVEQIAELKKNDPENELYTSLLDGYDRILSQLKEYIGDQPVQTPAEPTEAPVDSTEEVSVEAPEGEVEVDDTVEEIPTEGV